MMYFANSSTGIRTYIDDASKSESYFCPICNQAMVQKRGKINAHHFAHISSTACDKWYTEKSLWHSSWQARFPENSRERILGNTRNYHVADVFYNNIVIEFQHSSMSSEEFGMRSKFYSRHGQKLIWVIDCENEYAKGRLFYADDERILGLDYFRWEQPKRYLLGNTPNAINNVEIFLQIQSDRLLRIDQISRNLKGIPSYRYFWAREYSVDEFLRYVDPCRGQK